MERFARNINPFRATKSGALRTARNLPIGILSLLGLRRSFSSIQKFGQRVNIVGSQQGADNDGNYCIYGAGRGQTPRPSDRRILSLPRLRVPPSRIVVQPFASNFTPNPDGASGAIQQLTDRARAKLFSN